MSHGHALTAPPIMNRSKFVRRHFHFFQISFSVILLCLGFWGWGFGYWKLELRVLELGSVFGAEVSSVILFVNLSYQSTRRFASKSQLPLG